MAQQVLAAPLPSTVQPLAALPSMQAAARTPVASAPPAAVPQKSGHMVYYYAPGAVAPVLVEINDGVGARPAATLAAQRPSPTPPPPPTPLEPPTSVQPVPPVMPPTSKDAAYPAVAPQNMAARAPSTFSSLPPLPPLPSSANLAAQTVDLNPAPVANNTFLPSSYNSQVASLPPLSPSQQKPLLAQAQPGSPYYTNYMGLETRQGLDAAVQGFYYRYREPDLDVTSLGAMVGFMGGGTLKFGKGFATVEAAYAFGDMNYRGSGTMEGQPTDKWEVRLMGGGDIAFENFTISPYGGIAYRELYNDARGITTTGAAGYQRLNQIVYVPLGVHPRFRLSENARLSSTIEYNGPLWGLQTSYLGDADPGLPTVRNRQTSGGEGVRLDIMYETPWWSIGPFLNYWEVAGSTVQDFQSNSSTFCTALGAPTPCTAFGQEPANHTTEVGLQVKFHFGAI